MEVYVGRNRNAAPEVNQGQRVVLSLTEGLNGRNVTCDNFFSSHSLATELKKRQMTIVGTIRSNRVEIPPLLAKANMKKKPAQHSEFAFDLKLRATLVSYVPKKYKLVTLISTYHLNAAVDDSDKKNSEIIKYYYSTKGAVDTLDEMVGTYRCKRRVLRWPLALYENMLDISACNALVIFLANNPYWKHREKKFRRRLFLIELGESLVEPYIMNRKRMPHGKCAKDAVCRVRCVPHEPSPSPSFSSLSSASPRLSPVTSPRESPLPWLRTLEHTVQSKKRARCSICPYTNKANTHAIKCDRCQRYICPNHRYMICSFCCGKGN